MHNGIVVLCFSEFLTISSHMFLVRSNILPQIAFYPVSQRQIHSLSVTFLPMKCFLCNSCNEKVEGVLEQLIHVSNKYLLHTCYVPDFDLVCEEV